MSMASKIAEIKEFCITATQEAIAELQQQRFANQGAFNDNEEWADNSKLVVQDKGFNEPLVDSGDLQRDLTTPGHWDLNPISRKNSLTMTIPEEEDFTESKYDQLQDGGRSDPYTSPRGKKMPSFNLPARNFKKLSQADAEWVVKRLVQALERRFA